MKRTYLLIPTLLYLLVCLNAYSQDKDLTRNNNLLTEAEQYFNEHEYGRAIPIYELLDKRESATAVRRLGDCYRMINDLETAGTYYARAVEQKNLHSVYYYYYGQSLINKGNYLEARTYFEKFQAVNEDSELAADMILICDYALGKGKPGTDVSLVPLPLNTSAAEFGAVFYEDGIVYTSASNRGVIKKVDSYTNSLYLDLYFADPAATAGSPEIQPLKGDINTSKYHDGPASFSSDGKTIYFSRNNAQGNRGKASRSGEVKLRIYSAKRSGDQFTDAVALSFNGNEYSCSHPSVDEEKQIIFFSSDIGGGHGGADIYYSLFNLEKKRWSRPVNAGPSVNTSGDEYFPFIHPDGTLYFSSNGHLGYGGLDIFKVYPLKDSALVYSKAYNLGRPFNSSADDFSFVTDRSKRSGLLSSNRPGGKGGDDIYQFNLNGTIDRTKTSEIE